MADVSHCTECAKYRLRIAALQASYEELVNALAGMVEYFGVGSQGCACGRNDCPIRMAKVALTNAAKLAPTRAGGSGYER